MYGGFLLFLRLQMYQQDFRQPIVHQSLAQLSRWPLYGKCMRKALRTVVMLTMLAGSHQLSAQGNGNDSVRRTSFGLEYTSEVQTDCRRVRWDNLLRLQAEVPLSRTFTFEAASISVVCIGGERLVDDLQSYSNLDAENVLFALAVADFVWRPNEHHSLFAGLRRMDEDYFSSDGLGLFTNSSCGVFPTLSANYDIAIYPKAAMGLHYSYENENIRLQASLYNGTGHNKFAGRENIYRISPVDDGVFALGQAEYRHNGSRYFLGTSVHYSDLWGTAQRKPRPAAWAYIEQAISSDLTLIAAYSHAFSADNPCHDYCGIGATLAFGITTLGAFSNYTRIDGIEEWANELTCDIAFLDQLSLQPVLHIITTDGATKCVGLLRLNVRL